MRFGTFALYDNPRAGTISATVAAGVEAEVLITVLGIWSDGEHVRYLIVGGPKTPQGRNPRWVKGSDVDIHVGPAR